VTVPAGSWSSRPQLLPGVRLGVDPVGTGHVLLYPEGVVLLNETAAAVVAQCDGARDVAGIVTALERDYDDVASKDVLDVVRWLKDHWLARVDDG